MNLIEVLCKGEGCRVNKIIVFWYILPIYAALRTPQMYAEVNPNF